MRYLYGGDGAAQVTDAAGNAITGRAGTLWTASAGGSQVTDTQTPGGAGTGGVITTDDRGRLTFLGPDAATATYWWDGGDGVRWAIQPVETDRIARQQVETYGVLASTLGEPGGTATLDDDGRVPTDQVPDLSADYLPVPAGGSAGDALLRADNGAPYWGRLTPGTVSPWAALEAQPGTKWIAHRGGSLLAPENTIEAMRMADGLAADALEFDVYRVVDGGLMVMHDGTVDRTSNLSGIQSTTLTLPAALRGRIDAGTWFANTWPSDLRIPLAADVFADVGQRIPIICHCNNTGSGDVAVAEIQRQELDMAVLIMAWTEAELTAARAAGMVNCLLCATGDPPAGQTLAGLLAAGTTYIGVDYTQTTNAKIQAAAAAGLKVLVYTVNNRTSYAALPTDGSVWGVISDDPWYVKGGAALRSSDLFSAGTFYHGMAAPPDLHDYRGFFTLGSPNWWGLDASGTTQADINGNSGYGSVRHGYLGPLPSTFTLDCDVVLDAVDYATASAQLTLTVGDVPYDDFPTGSSTASSGYNILLRSNGTIDVYRVDAGTVTNVGTLATAAVTAGTTQHLKVQVTATQLIITRTNIAAPNSLTVTNSTYRGGMYPQLGVKDVKARWANIAIS